MCVKSKGRSRRMSRFYFFFFTVFFCSITSTSVEVIFQQTCFTVLATDQRCGAGSAVVIGHNSTSEPTQLREILQICCEQWLIFTGWNWSSKNSLWGEFSFQPSKYCHSVFWNGQCCLTLQQHRCAGQTCQQSHCRKKEEKNCCRTTGLHHRVGIMSCRPSVHGWTGTSLQASSVGCVEQSSIE